jgi:hypothetical protein
MTKHRRRKTRHALAPYRENPGHEFRNGLIVGSILGVGFWAWALGAFTRGPK